MLEKQKRQITKITVPNHIFIPLGLHSKENYAHSRPAFLIFLSFFLIDKEEYILKKKDAKRETKGIQASLPPLPSPSLAK